MRKPSKPERADIAVANTVAPARDSAPVTLLGRISDVADQPPLMTICGATIAAGLLLGRPGLARTGARMLAAEILATQLKSLVKHRIDRTRPSVLAEGRPYQARRGSDHASEMNSFPSGHTAGAVAVARAIARDDPQHGTAFYAAAAAVAAIQIPRSKHYMSDVAAGAIVGLAAETLVAGAERLARHIGRTWAKTAAQQSS